MPVKLDELIEDCLTVTLCMCFFLFLFYLQSFCQIHTAPRSSLESRHRPTGGRWFTVQISRGAKIKVGSHDLGI